MQNIQQTSDGLVRDGDHDVLTGLLTHHAFRALIDKRLAGGSLMPRGGRHHAILYFNIENFKHYNQRYSFNAGDTLIQHVAQSIQKAFPDKVTARFSADQFVVLTYEDEVLAGAKLVRSDFRREHKDSSIWLRAGYYSISEHDRDAGVACDRAKLACDELRGRRDAYIRAYDMDLQRHIRWRRYVLDHFDEAIERHWIQAWCQPIVRVATGETCDVEALARWIDPTEGVVPPFEFVPVLEEARVIHKMDLAIIEDVLRTCRRLADEGKPYIPVSFNLSQLDFELCDIVQEVCDLLDSYGIPRSMVAVEVTESALSGNAAFLKGEIDRFREAGIEVWMDDFGSGYSSLNVLKDYTFDLVKVDMAFLRGLEDNEHTRIMLAKVIDMAKELDLKTLVEGVETQEQYDFLRTLGCGRVQGWLFGKATSKPESIEGMGNDTHPEVELLGKREFYEEVGRVNLMRPEPKQSLDGHYLPGDVAAAIIRRRNGAYEYLNVNSYYEKFLDDVEIGTVADSEAIVNDPTHPRAKRFVQLIEQCAAEDGWHHYVLTEFGGTLVVRMRTITRLPEFDAIALLCVVDEVVDADLVS